MFLLSISGMFQGILDKLADIMNAVVSFLPLSPFSRISNIVISSEALLAINYIIPFGYIISVTEAWLMCIAVYYIYQVVLKWVKLCS